MRAMGVDFGLKRIGTAFGDTDLRIASPGETVAASGVLKRDAQALDTLARCEEAAVIVVGLPLEDGEPTPMSRVCTQLADRLRELGWDVRTVDESLSSVEAEEAMPYGRASQRRRRKDGAAACVILERFFEHA